MEMLELRKVPSMKGQPPRFNRKMHDGPTSLATQINGSPCEEDEDSQCAEAMGSWVQLPEDILHQIHAHMLLQDAARAACVSRGFLNSWRCYPKLVLNVNTLGINEDASKGVMTREFISRVDNIIHNRTCQGLKIFKLSTYPCSNLHPSYVDRWLQVAIRTGVKELALQMTRGDKMEYNFPCSLLSSETGSSIQSIFVGGCSFHSVVQVGSMSSSLTRVHLSSVHITGEELSCFMSNSCSLEQLCLSGCDDIIFLKVPCLLLRLNLLDVMSCTMLEVIDINAPNLSTFNFNGRAIHISLGASLQVREIQIGSCSESGMLYYAITRVPSIAPNIQILYLSTRDETLNTPMVPRRFLQLKYLEIELFTPNYSPDYDFYSLVSFLDASPALETFILRVSLPAIRHDSILDDSNGDSLHARCLSNYHHDKLKYVMVTGFCSAKSMVELTRHIIEKTSSLECLTLDTTRGYDKRFVKSKKCLSMNKEALMEAEKACLAIRTYVEGMVPSTVNLKIVEPCHKCHTKTLDVCQ